MRFKWLIMKLVVCFGVCLFGCELYAQTITSEKRIYLFDVTKSMIGRGSVNTPNIFDEVKKSLEEAVDDIADSRTEIVIIPFTDKPVSNEEIIHGTIAKKECKVWQHKYCRCMVKGNRVFGFNKGKLYVFAY